MTPEMISREENSSKRLYDAVFVLPTYPYPESPLSKFSLEGWEERLFFGWSGAHPSGLAPDSWLKCYAVGFLLEGRETNTVVNMSRAIRGYMSRPYSELMELRIKHFLSRRLRWNDEDVDHINFIQEVDSVDLQTEVNALKKLCRENQWNSVAIVTDAIHAKRTKRLLNREQIDDGSYEIRTIEEILGKPEAYVDPDNMEGELIIETMPKLLNRYNQSWFKKLWWLREAGLNVAPGFFGMLAQKTR